MIDDAELLRQYATDRTEQAFAELVRRHLGLVYGVALRQVGGDAHLAQDVAQEVFTALARKAPSLVARPALGGWLYQATQYAAINAVRRESRRRLRESAASIMAETELSSPPPMDLRPELDRVLAELGDSDRDAVVLRFFEEKSFAEIGRRFRLTENAARMRVERALDKLQSSLARRGVKSTTAAMAGALANSVSAAPAGLAATITQTAITTGATGGVLGVATLLTMSKLQIGAITAVIAIGTVGAGGYFWRQEMLNQQLQMATLVERQNREIAALTAEKERLAIETNAARTALLEAEQLRREDADLRGKTPSVPENRPLGGAALVKPPPAPVQPKPATDATPVQARTDSTRAATQARNLVNRRYAGYFAQAQLTPDERNKLTQLLIDTRSASADFAAANASTGLDVSDDQGAFQGTVYDLRQNIKDQIHALLGDNRYDDFVAADQLVQRRAVVDRLQKNLKASGEQLTTAQSTKLVDVMTDLHVTGATQDLVDNAGDILNPAQIQALQAIAARRQQGVGKDNIQRAIKENLPGATPTGK